MRRLVESRDGATSQGDTAVHDSEPGLAVLDPDLVRVCGGEEEADGEREGGAAAGAAGGGGGDADVLDGDLLEVELRLLRFDGEDDDEDDGEDDESDEREKEEEAATAAFDQRRRGGGTGEVRRRIGVVVLVRRRRSPVAGGGVRRRGCHDLEWSGSGESGLGVSVKKDTPHHSMRE